MSTISRRAAVFIGAALIAPLWMLVIVLAGAASLELLLRIQSQPKKAHQQNAIDPRPRYNRLKAAYRPFTIQHLHPQYLFFFPLEPVERMAIANAICSVDRDGFRGPGPSHAGGRQVAFLLGGSAAFGHYASSDATTITGYLNRLQDKYFFVNAGVPSWNSTQELIRVAFQILDYKPALVVIYDGANDLEILLDYYEKGLENYAIGAPESFKHLVTLVDNIRAEASGPPTLLLLNSMFPELSKRFQRRTNQTVRSTAGASGRSALLPESLLVDASAKYLQNLARMRNLVTAQGARFVAFFQPVSRLHQRVNKGFKANEDEREAYIRFHKAVMDKNAHDFEFHDLASIFDRHYATVPVMNEDLRDETVFVDKVHLYDPGNRIVAQHLVNLLRLPRTTGGNRVDN